MTDEKLPVQPVISLIKACLTAFILAMLLLLIAVLPAEYGIDPTGLGEKMGLTALAGNKRKVPSSLTQPCSEPKQVKEPNASGSIANVPVSELQPLDPTKQVAWKDKVEIVIPPKKGLEYKFAMNKGAVLEFAWRTDGALIYYDFHGEPTGAVNGYFKSYQEKMESESAGVLTAPFDGIHGWYWENESNRPITVKLNTSGDYRILGIMP